jgi:hypothetical protein
MCVCTRVPWRGICLLDSPICDGSLHTWHIPWLCIHGIVMHAIILYIHMLIQWLVCSPTRYDDSPATRGLQGGAADLKPRLQPALPLVCGPRVTSTPCWFTRPIYSAPRAEYSMPAARYTAADLITQNVAADPITRPDLFTQHIAADRVGTEGRTHGRHRLFLDATDVLFENAKGQFHTAVLTLFRLRSLEKRGFPRSCFPLAFSSRYFASCAAPSASSQRSGK